MIRKRLNWLSNTAIVLLSLIGSIQISIASDQQCKLIWQDDWFVKYGTEQTQLLGWSEGFGDTRGLFFYRSHEIIFFKEDENAHPGDKFIVQKIYFDDDSAPRNIAGIALDDNRLFVSFHNYPSGIGSGLRSFSWSEIQSDLNKSSSKKILITEKNSANYDMKIYYHAGQASDGIGHIYVTPGTHYLYGQYSSELYTWDKDGTEDDHDENESIRTGGKALGWSDDTDNIYRNHILTVDPTGSHFFAVVPKTEGRYNGVTLLDCGYPEGCISGHTGTWLEDTDAKAEDIIPLFNRNRRWHHPLLDARAMDINVDQHRKILNYDMTFVTTIPGGFKEAGGVRVTGFVQGSPEDKNHVYLLKAYFDDPEAVRYDNRVMALFQCDFPADSI